MRKVIALGIFFLLLSFGGRIVDKAQACVNWCAGSDCVYRDPLTGVCQTWATNCCDGAGGGGICAAGYYSCSSGCCPVTGGGTCGGTWSAWSPIKCCPGDTQTKSNACGNTQTQACTQPLTQSCCGKWGNFGTCFGSCGGPGAGTQFRTDNCGYSESRPCDLPACATPTPTPTGCTAWGACSAVCPTTTGTQSCISGTGSPRSCSITCSGNNQCNSDAQCGNGLCCNLGNCGTCSGGTDTTPVDNSISVQIYNDVNEECSRSYGGWKSTDPAYLSPLRLYVNTNSSNYNELTPRERMQAGIRIRAMTVLLTGPDKVNQYIDMTGPPGGTRFNAATGVGSLSLEDLPAGYRCSACNSSTCPQVRAVGNKILPSHIFYITNKTTVTSSWWQVEGAGVYAGSDAGGVTIESQLPSAATTLIVPSTGGTDSVVLRGSGSMSLGSGTVSSALWNTVAKYKGKRMDYSYFSANMGVLRNQASDWQSDTLNLQAYNPSKEFWYTAPTSGEATISAPWTVGVGEKYIVFVNGDLRIASNISVADGGFLAFIVNGGVTVDPSVTSMQGLFVMDNNFTTETVDSTGVIDDVALSVEGSVVAWGTFGLHRDLGLSNGSTPAEKFSYRPDLLVNMPPKMKSFALHWSEVPAGTFGN